MKRFFLLLTFVCLWEFSNSCTGNDEVKVTQAAQDNLAATLSKIPAGQEKSYGFLNREEFNQAVIGKPYRLITVNQDFLLDEKLISKNYFSLQNEWRVPVCVNGEYRLLLTVVQHDENFEVVDLGGAVLAKDLQTRENNRNAANHYILRIYQLKYDFLVCANKDQQFEDATYVPLTSATMVINPLNEKNELNYAYAETLALVKKHLNEQVKK